MDANTDVKTQAVAHLAQLMEYLRAAPSSFHAASQAAKQLGAAGFTRQDPAQPWDASPGGHYLLRGGGLCAWWVPPGNKDKLAFKIIGVHTDSPTFKLKPHPHCRTAGTWEVLGVETYGGLLYNSWLDRELGLAGQLVTRQGEAVLVSTGPVARIPQLAIHLDRNVNESLHLDPQKHLRPIWQVGQADPLLGLLNQAMTPPTPPAQAQPPRAPSARELTPEDPVLRHLAKCAGLAGAGDIASYDVFTYCTEGPGLFGTGQEFLAAGRLDNLLSVHAALQALLAVTAGAGSGSLGAAADPGQQNANVLVLAAFDHEEVGSQSTTGAGGPLLEQVLRRTAGALGATADEYEQALARSSCISADCGHGVHPNYPDRHDPDTRPRLGGGPMLKLNAKQRYASCAQGAAIWAQAVANAGVPAQEFVSNNAMPCGSTIGPITATRLGITTVDVGAPLLSMHSAREMCHYLDPWYLTLALAAYWQQG